MSLDPQGAAPTQTILVLDDEPAIRSLTIRLLEREGFDVLTAGSGRDALAILGRYNERIALLIVDVKLPDMSGREFVHHATARFGDRPILYVSGVDQHGRTDALHRRTIFLAKPFDSAELLHRVRVLIARPDGAEDRNHRQV